MELPASLRAAVARELEGVSRKGLAERAARASAAYRSGKGSAGVIRDPADALAYALARLPATYAACASVFREAAARAPGFAPRRLLDAGAGPAAASWAALEAWPSLAEVSLLDASPVFLETAARLAADGPDPLRQAARLRADLTGGGGAWPRADLVACSYALAEIDAPAQAGVVGDLWSACDGVLALVEPGTPAGFARLRRAREALVAAGAAILAPCPHDQACPIAGEDWCHFSVRLPRSRDHRLVKGAEVPFEDEPFAYLVAARPGLGAPAEARVLRPPRHGKPGVELALCTRSGLATRLVTRRDKRALASARRAGWGEAWTFTDI
jgi:ribosomal protein RSM22 (predicted rRNA methylase)